TAFRFTTPKAAAVVEGIGVRVGAAQLTHRFGKLFIADAVGATIFKVGRWFGVEPALDVEDDAVYRLMQETTSKDHPYTAWFANGIRWADDTFMPWTYENLNRIGKRDLYKYLRHKDRLTRIGSYFAEQAAIAGASLEAPNHSVNYKYLQFLVEDPQSDPFLKSTVRQLLADPVSHEGGWWAQDTGTFNLPDVSKLLSDAIVWDSTTNTLKVKDEWAFRNWVDSLPVPTHSSGTYQRDELQARGFNPTPLIADEIGEKGRRSRELALTLGELYDSAEMLDGKIATSPEIREIAEILKQNKSPEQGKYHEESVYLAKEFVYTSEAIDTLYFAATLREPAFLDQQMARPLALAERVTDLAKNVFGFPADPVKWRNRVPILEGMPVAPGNPALPQVGAIIGWLELSGPSARIDIALEEPIHLLETDARNFWLMTSPGYNVGLFETVSFADFRGRIIQKADEKKAHMRETVQRTLRDISKMITEGIPYVGEPEAIVKPPEEDLRYGAYRELASSQVNAENLFENIVQEAEAMGIDSGEIGDFERRMVSEMVKMVGEEVQSSIAEFRGDLTNEVLFKDRSNGEIALEALARLGSSVMTKARALNLDTGEIGELSDQLLALAVIQAMEAGTYLKSVPEEYREAASQEYQKKGLVVKNGNSWALNANSSLIQVMSRFRKNVLAERSVIEAKMKRFEDGQVYDQEMNAAAEKASPPINLETKIGQDRATQLAIQRNPNGAVATNYRFQENIIRSAFLGLLSKDESERYKDLLAPYFQAEQQ
ncbi:MAG: hypothetical protein Q7S98_04420, partial [Deltaproteobacteria bacterium]|nr:hypothetical protein [Deltaproteobacteria bacterium]